VLLVESNGFGDDLIADHISEEREYGKYMESPRRGPLTRERGIPLLFGNAACLPD
jgi:hypothetical protein